MHKKILINNFKCFSEHTEIELGLISVCLGSNSVGKSSVIQSCIMQRQIYEKMIKEGVDENNRVVVQLNDVYGLHLGDAEHIKSSKELEDVILGVDNYEFRLHSSQKSPYEMEVPIGENEKKINIKEGIFSERFYYLNAERLGPRNYQIIDSKNLSNCGVYGENTVHFLSENSFEKVDDERCYKLDREKTVQYVAKQIEYWMDYIIPGINIRANDVNELRLSKIQFQQTALDTDFLSPYSFGFGISYVLPIILTGLIAPKGSMFLVENPEAHLHPKGQSHIGYFLAMMAFAGVQVVVETHSEHVLNGIRIAALKEGKRPEDIAINFFSIENNGTVNTIHKVKRIELNERMDVKNWPEGFMDQEEEDLRMLRELRRK